MDRRLFIKDSFMLVAGGMVFGANAFGEPVTASTAAALAKKYTSSDALYKLFQAPGSQYHPFVRWWWNGDKVEAEELIRELHLLKEAGIGGVEINPIEFPAKSDPLNKKALKWLSDEWIDMLKVVFDEAKKLDMTCDLIVGSGWPFGAETLPLDERAEVMLTYAKVVDGGEKFEVSKFDIYKEIDPGVTVVNHQRTLNVVSVKVSPDPISDLSEIVDVTDQCQGDIISIDIPEGKHCVYVLVNVKSFACVINGAPGAAGSILNHMDAKAVRKYLDNMTDHIEPKTGPLRDHLRAFFVDSMELEGNNWTADFAEEFKKRRGYDVMPWLPFTMFKVGRLGAVVSYDFGAKKSEEFTDKVNRVRFDFELTKAELLHERYTETFLQWCRDKGVMSRAQAYGRGFFPLETSLDYDIPEGESWTTNWLRHRLGEEMGDEDYRRGRGYTMINKYVSSAAHLKGKRLVSAEEMTNTYKVFITSLEFLKVGSDMSAISGTTHSVWHGFNYSPPDAPYPGWIQYGSYYNENNPWWPYFKYLNEYRARMSALLQNADMLTDIALLPANYDLWTELGCQTDPFPEKLNIPYTSLIWEAIHKNGGGADYVTEIVIRDATVRKGKLCYGVKEYGTIFLIEVSGTTPETLAKLQEFVAGGGRVFCIGKYPDRSLGLKDCEARDAEIKAAVERLKAYPDNFILLEKPSDGKYLEWYKDVMKQYSLPHTITVSDPDRFLLINGYKGEDKSDMFLIVNAHMSEARETDLIIPDSIRRGKAAWIYDPATGQRYSVTLNGNTLHLKLGPSESYVLVFNRDRSAGKAWKQLPNSGYSTITVKDWDLALHNKHEDWTKEAHFDVLKDLKDTEWNGFSGDVTYKATFEVEGTAPKYINLGKVSEICELKINGQDCGMKWFGERVYDVSGIVKTGTNTIEVKVTTLLANYLLSLKDNTQTNRWLTRRNQGPVSSGLIGPVKLYR